MSRPTKEGLDYFSIDTDILSDDKIKLIKAKHGLAGFAVIILLLTKVYHNGYFYEWSDDAQYLFADDARVDVNVVNNVVNDCINKGFFSKELYEQYGVLTSRGIQKRFLQASQRRKKVVVYRELFLVDDYIKELSKDNVSIIPINVINNSVNDDLMSEEIPQSKVKEIEIESKDKESLTRAGAPARARDLEVFADVCKAIQKIRPIANDTDRGIIIEMIDHFPRDWILNAIRLSIDQQGRSYKHVQTFLNNWQRHGYKETDKPWEVESYDKHPRHGPQSRSRPYAGMPGSRPSQTDWENEPDHL